MSSSRSTFARTYATLVGVALVPAGVVAGLGCVVVSGLSTDLGFRSVLAGCGVSWVAGCVGAIPIALVLVARSTQAVNSVLASTAIRFVSVLLLVVPLMLSGWFNRKALVSSVAVSYLVMLLVDSIFAAYALKRMSENES